MSLRSQAPSPALIHHVLIPQASFGLDAIHHSSSVPTLGMGPTTLRVGSPGLGPIYLAWRPLPLIPGLALALRSTLTLHSSTFSSPWGLSQRSDNGAYFTLVPGGGPKSPPQILFNLSHNILQGLRSKSALAHRGEALVDPLHQVQDELPVGGTSQLLEGSIPPSLLGPFWFGKVIILTICNVHPDVISPSHLHTLQSRAFFLAGILDMCHPHASSSSLAGTAQHAPSSLSPRWISPSSWPVPSLPWPSPHSYCNEDLLAAWT